MITVTSLASKAINQLQEDCCLFPCNNLSAKHSSRATCLFCQCKLKLMTVGRKLSIEDIGIENSILFSDLILIDIS